MHDFLHVARISEPLLFIPHLQKVTESFVAWLDTLLHVGRGVLHHGVPSVVASLATLSGVTYMIGVLESFEIITMENWSDVDRKWHCVS